MYVLNETSPERSWVMTEIRSILLSVEKPAKIYLVQTVVDTTQKWCLLYVVLSDIIPIFIR